MGPDGVPVYQYTAAGDFSSAYFTDHQNNFTEELRASSTDKSNPCSGRPACTTRT